VKHSCWERDEAYRRRLRVITPVAVVLVAALFVTSDQVSFQEIERSIGWKGELQLMPEITIITDDPSDRSDEHHLAFESMSTVDIALPEGQGIEAGATDDDKQAQNESTIDIPEFDPFDLSTVEARREAPYSQDYVLIRMVEPVYPPDALRDGLEGHVTVELLVDEAGSVASATVISALGPVSFQDATLAAVRQFQFEPPRRNGEPTSMWIKFRVKFRIFG